MIAYLIILGTSLLSFAGVGMSSLVIGTLLLFTHSLYSHRLALRQIQDRGTNSIFIDTYTLSFAHAVAASATAYCMGILFRIFLSF